MPEVVQRFGTKWNKGYDFNGETAFRQMQTAFEQFVATYPDTLSESDYTFGGQRVRMRIAGRELAQHISRPFAHLRIPEQPPGSSSSSGSSGSLRLTINLWDEGLAGGERRGRNDTKWHETSVLSSDRRFVGQRLPNTFTCLDRKTETIMSTIAWSKQIFIYERAKPLARPLLEWHNDRDLQMIHAGLVARNGQGVLFAGKSGSGKSTSALACLCAGFHFLSEDYVAIEQRPDSSFAGHSVYNSVFLNTDHLARFPNLSRYVLPGHFPYEKKSVLLLSQVFPERLARVVPIRALVLPRLVTTVPQVCPASKGEALLAFGPSSLLQIPNRRLGMRGFATLARLVEQIPSYWLDIGRDEIDAIPHQVEEVLARVSRG